MATARALITAAGRKLGIAQAGDPLSADEIANGLEAYNGLLMRLYDFGSRLSNQPTLTGSTGQAEVGGIYRMPSGATFTLTAPLNPRHGARFGVVDANLGWTANALTISRNGALINALAANYSINVNGQNTNFFYEGDTGNWIVEAEQTIDQACPFPSRITSLLGDMIAAYWAQEFGVALKADTLATALEGQERFARQYGRRGPNALDRPILFKGTPPQAA